MTSPHGRRRRIQIEPPSVTRHIARTLERYPDGGQILKELIQNADDAGATEVKFQLDTRQHSTDDLIAPSLSHFQGPALYAYNNAVFQDDDWEHFGKMEDSGKETVALKVGRFGVGFLSVFHITDLPMVISTDTVALLDPHKMYTGSDRMGWDGTLSEFFSHDSHASCFEGIFGLDRTIQSYNATLFRFPLRQCSSEIAKSNYPAERVKNFLYNSFIDEAPVIMLFLKYVQEISLYNGDRLIYRVSIDRSQVGKVSKERKALLALAEKEVTTCTLRVYSVSFLTEDYRKSDSLSRQYHWLVMNMIGTNDSSIRAMSVEQNNISWVGTAAPLPQKTDIFNVVSRDCSDVSRCITDLQNCFRHVRFSMPWCNEAQGHLDGQVFCFLPLPGTTNLPVNIHGYFSVSDNRRSIEWPASDNKSAKALWNKALLDKHISPLYSILLACRTFLVNYTGTPLPEIGPVFELTDPYAAWPLSSNVRFHHIWKDLVQPVISKVANVRILWTPAQNGRWVSLTEAFYLPTPGSFPFKKAVIDVLINKANLPIVSLPFKIHETLVECGQQNILTQRTVTPVIVRRALKSLRQFSFQDRETIEDLLECILSDITEHNCDELVGIKLLPVGANISFKTDMFKQATRSVNDILYVVNGNSDALRFLPGIEERIVVIDLKQPILSRISRIAMKGCLQIRLLTPDSIASYLLPLSIQSWFPALRKSSSFNWTPGRNGHPSREWIIDVWSWLSRNHQIFDMVIGLPLIPVNKMDDTSPTVSLLPIPTKTGLLFVNMDSKSDETALANLLSKMKATVVQYNQFVFNFPFIKEYILHIDVCTVLEYIGHRGNHMLSSLTDEDKAFLRCSISQYYANSRNNPFVNLIKKLPIFEAGVGANPVKLVSIAQGYILPDPSIEFNPELHYPLPLLNNGEIIVVKLLQSVGCQSLQKSELFVRHIIPFALHQCQSSQQRWCNGDSLIVWLLNQGPMQVLSALSTIAFIRTKADRAVFKKPSELYDSNDDQFEQLFDSDIDPVFPSDDYRNVTDKLLSIGLMTWRKISQNVSSLVPVIKERAESVKFLPFEKAFKRSSYIMDLIAVNSRFSAQLMEALQQVQFLAVHCSRPSFYPACLQWIGDSKRGSFEAPCNMCSTVDSAALIGAVIPIVADSYNVCPATRRYFKSVSFHDVLQQFHMLVNCVKRPLLPEENETKKVSQIVHSIYKYFNEWSDGINPHNLPKAWIWWPNEQGQQVFMSPKSPSLFIWKAELSLSPIIYSISDDQQMCLYKSLFFKAGIKESLSLAEVVSVLKKVALMFHKQPLDQKYLTMSVDIVKYLKEKGYQSPGDVYLPTTDSLLLLAKDCTYDDREWVRRRVGAGISKYKFVHESIPPSIAQYFNVEPLSKKVAPSTKLQLKYIKAGPKERVTRRISGIVKDYSGNIDVFKELIQNADDAGASKVKLLVDWRVHGKDYLFSEEMHHWQGPALIAYNDATFSDQDFVNICELAAETKMKDPMKTGRFGVGFCSCYSLTDVPSFVSRHSMTIFDPHTKYLGDRVSHNEPGMRINIVEQSDELEVYRDQFSPFDGLFDCHIFRLTGEGYNGTIFRFPLRMKSFPKSEICNEHYDHYAINSLVEELRQEADSVLIFLKNVKLLQLFVIQSGAESPAEMELQFEVNKQSTEHNSRLQLIRHSHSIQTSVCYELTINVTDPPNSINSSSKHLVASALSTSTDSKSGLISLAELAIPLSFKSPFNGNLFCFLPLPLKSYLPFHVNGFFDVGKDRRGLKDADQSSEYQWNENLVRTVLPLALESALASLSTKIKPESDSELKRYYSLWPGAYTATTSTGRRNWVSEVFSRSAGQTLCNSQKKLVWSRVHNGKWISPMNAYLFQDGGIPFEIKQEVVSLILSEDYSLVECPHHVMNLLSKALNASHKLNYEWFFEDIFLPNVKNISESVRYHQLLFVLNKLQEEHHSSFSPQLYTAWASEAIKSSACIQVAEISNCLVQPEKLIDVRCKPITELYEASEGRFPSDRFNKVMTILTVLGMITKELPLTELKERAETISKIDREKAQARLTALLQYIHYIENQSVHQRYLYSQLQQQREGREKRIEILKNVPCLLSLPKPNDVSLPWYSIEPSKLYTPSELYSPKCSALVFTMKPLFCLPVMDDSMDEEKMVVYLGINKNLPTVEVVLDHLCKLVEHLDQYSLDQQTIDYLEREQIFSSIYKFLDQHMNDDEHAIVERLQHKRCIWQKRMLLLPKQVLTNWNEKPCHPYFCPLSEGNLLFKNLLKAIGVQEEATLEYLLKMLTTIHEDYPEQPLSENVLEFVNAITRRLSNLIRCSNDEKLSSDILLPDEEGILRPASKLSCDHIVKGEWITDLPVYKKHRAKGGRCIHKSIPRDRALVLGSYGLMETVLREIEDESFLDGTDFGQSEELVDRLNGILKKYPADTSIFREFIQNADDAKATEIVFVLDHRKDHPKHSLLSDNPNWKQLQSSPALCIYNNRQFTETDIEGICKLGRGGKGDTSDTIGRFGIGFNVAYHLSDCPNFVSFDKDGHPKDFCVFDPLKRYCKKATKARPGRRWKVNREHFEQFPDQFAPFQFDSMQPISDCFGDKSNGFVMFRLPLLRYDPTTHYYMTYSSRITDKGWLMEGKAHTPVLVGSLLKQFKLASENMLLFLNHIQSISVFEINTHEDCIHHFTSKVTVDEGSRHLTVGRKIVQPISLVCETSITHQVKNMHTQSTKETVTKWIISKRGGFDQSCLSDRSIHSKADERGLEAFGGVAAQLATEAPLVGSLFCFLPMNIPSCLPVHLNAHFLVDDSRRHLESLPGLEKWNTTVAEHLLIPAYIDLLLEAREKVDGSKESIQWFYNLFPQLSSQSSEASQMNMKQLLFERILKENCHILLDARGIAAGAVEWLPLSGTNCGLFCINHVIVQNHFLIKAEEMRDVLISLDMPITCAPKHIFTSLLHVSTDYKATGIVTPAKVLQWLKGTDVDCEDNEETIKKNCELLLEFCLQNCSQENMVQSLTGVPLLLTLGDTLVGSGKLYRSEFSLLLPHLKESFIEPTLEKTEIGKQLRKAGVIVDIPVHVVSKHISLENVNDPTALSSDNADLVKLLWMFLSYMNASFQLPHDVWQFFSHKPILPASDGLFYPPVIGKCLFRKTEDNAHVQTAMAKLGYRNLDFNRLEKITPAFMHSLVSVTSFSSHIIECLKLRPPQVTSVKFTVDEVSQLISVLYQVDEIPTIVAAILKRLPLFQTVDGSYICLSTARKFYIKPLLVPKEGILSIQKETNEVVLGNPDHQANVFLQKVVSESEYELAHVGGELGFYLHFLIPHFSCLSESELEHHLAFVKRKYQSSFYLSQMASSTAEWQRVIDMLKVTPLLSKEDGKRQLVSTFFDPEVEFHATFQAAKLLPKKWHTSEWLPFLRVLGLQRSVSTALWLAKAKKVGEKVDIHKPPTESLIAKSAILIASFESIVNTINIHLQAEGLSTDFINFLDEASKIPFLYCTKQYYLVKDIQTVTGQSPIIHEYFIRFHESVYYNSSDMTCLVRKVLPDKCQFLAGCDPVFSKALSIREPINLKAVVQNLISISKHLSTVKVFSPSNEKDEAIERIKGAIEKHYSYMEKHLDEKVIRDLINNPCILLTTRRNMFQLVKPSQLVIHISQGTDLQPFCFGVPPELMKYSKLLTTLNIKKEIEPLQYIQILANIKEELDRGGKKLSEDTCFSKVCNGAYNALVQTLRVLKDPTQFPDNLVIYLPSDSMDLVKSSDLVHNDVPWIATRIKAASSNSMNRKFLLPPPLDGNGQRTPPSALKVKSLSELAVELLHEDTKSRLNRCIDQELFDTKKHPNNCQAVEVLEKTLQSSDFRKGLGRLYWHQNQKHPRTDGNFCRQLRALIQLKIHCVNDIKTKIYLEGRDIPKTEDSSHLCILLPSNNHDPLKLYITHKVDHYSEDQLFEELAKKIGEHLHHNTGDAFYIKAILKCFPNQISMVLDKLQVSPFDAQMSTVETIGDQDIGSELLPCEVAFTKEDLLIICNYEKDEKVVYHCLDSDGKESFKFGKIVECSQKTQINLKDKCVKIQIGINTKKEPVVISTSLFQIYKQLTTSQVRFLETGQGSAYTTPLVLAPLPESLEEIKKWLRETLVYNGHYFCCSESQLSLRLTAHLHYMLKNKPLFLQATIKIIEEEETTPSREKPKQATLSIQDDIGEPPPTPPLVETISRSASSQRPSPQQQQQPSFSSYPRRPLFALPSTPSSSQPVAPVSSNIPAYRINPPWFSFVSGQGAAPINRGIGNPFVNRVIPDPPQPQTDIKSAKMWLQQGKADYLAAGRLMGETVSDDVEREIEEANQEDSGANEGHDAILESEDEDNDIGQLPDEEEEDEDNNSQQEEDEEEMMEGEERFERAQKVEFPALVCFLCHDVVEKCTKGLMYAKCGLPTHLINNSHLQTLQVEMEKSCHVSEDIKRAFRECVMQVNEHSNRSRYPHYQVPPCAPASVYTSLEAAQAVYATRQLLQKIREDDSVTELIGDLKELPEEVFKFSVLSAANDDYPSYWDKHDTKDGDFKLVLVSPHSDEYCRITALFQQTQASNIERIERIQNKLLWQRYIDCAKRTIRYSKRLGEKQLFHGTRMNDPGQIYEGDASFDMRYSHNGMWGTGNYFAVNASYSHRYAHRNGQYHQMLVASVLTGVAYFSQPDNNLRQPPFRPGRHEGIQQRYDSVTGNTGGSNVYITYDNERAYPMYLITYR